MRFPVQLDLLQELGEITRNSFIVFEGFISNSVCLIIEVLRVLFLTVWRTRSSASTSIPFTIFASWSLWNPFQTLSEMMGDAANC